MTKIVPVSKVEVKINESVKELCIIYEGQTAEEVANKIAAKHKLNSISKQAIIQDLEQHLKSLANN